MNRTLLLAAMLATTLAAGGAAAQERWVPGHWDWAGGRPGDARAYDLRGPGVRMLFPELRDTPRGHAFVLRNFDWGHDAFITQDLANYHVPVHADVPDIDAVFLEEFDSHANVLGSKGVGELGICGSGAAVANAVYNACGVRVRDYPLTLDKVLPELLRRPNISFAP